MPRRNSILRAKFLSRLPDGRPASVDHTSWQLFVTHVRDGKTLTDISRESDFPLWKLTKLITRIEFLLDNAASAGPFVPTSHDELVESLPLSTKTLNTIRRMGIESVDDLRDLDLTKPVPHLGATAIREINLALGRPEPDPSGLTVSQLMYQEIERVRERIARDYMSCMKELDQVQKRLGAVAGVRLKS